MLCVTHISIPISPPPPFLYALGYLGPQPSQKRRIHMLNCTPPRFPRDARGESECVLPNPVLLIAISQHGEEIPDVRRQGLYGAQEQECLG